jgi:hypothetical protein
MPSQQVLCLIWLQYNSVLTLGRIAGGFVYCSTCHPQEEKELINDTIDTPYFFNSIISCSLFFWIHA